MKKLLLICALSAIAANLHGSAVDTQTQIPEWKLAKQNKWVLFIDQDGITGVDEKNADIIPLNSMPEALYYNAKNNAHILLEKTLGKTIAYNLIGGEHGSRRPYFLAPSGIYVPVPSSQRITNN